jgi:hypothetical protein
MILGVFFWGWFRFKTNGHREWRYPAGLSEVSVAGNDPGRILIIGDGPAAGLGVRTHELGIAGQLARHVSGELERGVVVTIAAQPAASARSTLRRLGDLHLDGYDSIVLMLATTDAFCLTTRRSWRRNMIGLVHALNSAGASVFVTSTASLPLARPLTPFARRPTDGHARTLDDETRRICAQTNTPMISLNAASDLTSHTYRNWGRRIGSQVADSMRRQPPTDSHQGEVPRSVQGSTVVRLYRTRLSFRHVKTRVPVNRYGQIPAVLVNPKCVAGSVIEGVWLGDSHDYGADGIRYVRVRAGAS